ncbi:NAD(P)/FAD-dependent oxidoreductase [Isosphaeraceae bacterium EP7]
MNRGEGGPLAGEAVEFDLVVVGAGMGGLATAGLAASAGCRVALLEAHTHLGGCAGYFSRGPYTFDAGATALMGLEPGQPIGDLLAAVGARFEHVPRAGYRVCLPDRRLLIGTPPATFLADSRLAFPGHDRARGLFWGLQEAVGSALFRAAGGIPRLPTLSPADWAHNLAILGPRGLLAASTWTLSVLDVLRLLGLHRDRPFLAFIAMLLQDTAQAGPETVPFSNAAACLHAYRLGMARPVGGMKALAEGLGGRFAALGGSLRTGTIVDRVEADPGRGGFVVTTRRRDRLKTRQVAFNLPVDLAAALLSRPLVGRLGGQERKSRAAWGAFTGYLAIGAAAVPDDAPLFHQVLQSYDLPPHDGNNVLVSLSPPGDEGYGPPSVRVATLSTHTRPQDWDGLDAATYAARKADYRGRLLAALGRALPDAPGALRHEEFASPRSFRRYTRRTLGAVGGPPVSRRNSNLLAVGPNALGPGLWLVGDSVFPGQGTMATVLSAARVVERITGQPWRKLKAPFVA